MTLSLITTFRSHQKWHSSATLRYLHENADEQVHVAIKNK